MNGRSFGCRAHCESDRRRLRAPVLAALFAYATLLVGSSVLHHDFACHQTSRTHCTACTWTQMTSGIQSDDPAGTLQLPPAGEPQTSAVPVADTLLTPRSSGRSPPRA